MSSRASARSSRASSPADSGIRKRVGKACDRCRMKKSKCDGATPCGKCKADNAICVYGRRKRSANDKVYPRGYVEMLEHQQTQLVVGLQELYRRSIQHGKNWDGELPPETSREKVPMTHDLLAWLGALREDEHNGSDEFYEDFYTMQAIATLEHPESIKGDVPLEDRTQIRANQPQSQNISQAPRIESTQSLSETSNLLPIPPTAARLSQTFSGIPWHTEPAELQLMDFNIHESWMYDANIQTTNMYITGTEVFQQPAETSINPYLTLKDWSITDRYQADKEFPCTWLA